MLFAAGTVAPGLLLALFWRSASLEESGAAASRTGIGSAGVESSSVQRRAVNGAAG